MNRLSGLDTILDYIHFIWLSWHCPHYTEVWFNEHWWKPSFNRTTIMFAATDYKKKTSSSICSLPTHRTAEKQFEFHYNLEEHQVGFKLHFNTIVLNHFFWSSALPTLRGTLIMFYFFSQNLTTSSAFSHQFWDNMLRMALSENASLLEKSSEVSCSFKGPLKYISFVLLMLLSLQFRPQEFCLFAALLSLEWNLGKLSCLN